MTPTRVRIFYPADPLGVVPGGIDTFIRGLIKWAPEDLHFSLVGMTTDPDARPVGQFTRCALGPREFDFFPAVHVADAGRRGSVPLSMRYTLATARMRAALSNDFDVFDFHRIEPALLFLRDERPKNAFFHQDPQVVRSAQSDILWKRLPKAYEAIEAKVAPRLSSAWCVRESGVATLKKRYLSLADQCRFVPTWVDTSVFSPLEPEQRECARLALGLRLGLDPEAKRIVTVGRLDSQKDPRLMLEAFAHLVADGRRLVLLIVGDGEMRASLAQRVGELGIGSQVRFLGLLSATQIADLLRASDMYALSSAYEGMPMALLEAMGCGLPAATTDVGEVRRVVKHGVNGAIAAERSPEAFADCVGQVLDHLDAYSGAPALEATQAFHPAHVLAPVYENYRELGAMARRNPGHVAAPLHPDAPPRPFYSSRRREHVIGAPVDVLGAARAREVIMDWATQRESRYVCFCNVHSAVTHAHDPRHARAIDGADLVAADGAPIAWMLRRKGHAGQPRLDGPGTMWALCGDAEARGIKIGLYGSTPETLHALRQELGDAFPDLQISFCQSPPFKPLSAEQDEAVCREIERSEVGLLFVAFGCPKQERWMAEHAGRIGAVMLGVGAAFDFHAGLITRAPGWMQRSGLEWLHRVASEPGRLWQRYLFSNSVFIMRSATELAKAGVRRAKHGPVRLSQRVVVAKQGASPVKSRLSGRSKNLDQQHMTELLARVDASMSRRSGRVIEFIASGEGEGTSTLAAAYAHTAAFRLNRRVLLLSAQSESPERAGVLEAIANSRPMESAISRHAGGYWSGALFGEAADELGWALAERNELWKVMRGAFDEVVLDMPSSSASRIGVMMASHCDGVIVVLEAEKTRAPVVEALVASLQAVRANLLGTVLNKRQFHVPDALYRRL